MDTLIELIIVFSLGIWLGSIVTAAINRAVFKALLEELGIGNKELVELARRNGMEVPGVTTSHAATGDDLDVIDIKLETHNGMIYAFRKDNEEFLGQGENREQLITRLKEKLTQVRLVVAQEDGAALIREQDKG